MFRFENPLDPSKDGLNPVLDGIRFNIRNSEMIKEELLEKLPYIETTGEISPLAVLEYMLENTPYDLEDLTIADEHEILDAIRQHIN